MEEFKLGDKVRSKYNHTIMGTISEICWDHWYGQVDQTVTVMVMSEEGCMKYETFNAVDIEKIDEEKETKEMTSYKVGDIVNHPLYNESIIIDVSRFENGFIEIVPLTGSRRGLPILVSIDAVKHGDNNFIISIDDYNKMANTIENLKKEKVDLQERLYAAYDKARLAEATFRLSLNSFYGIYGNKNLPEIKSVLYHKPATIIFWKDGTKTVVKARKNEKYDNEKGFVMAYLKKILGNEDNYYEKIKRWTDIK